jgi:predicted deacylase
VRPAEGPASLLAGKLREHGGPRRVVGDLGDPGAGPTLVVVGGMHGNEPAGVAAARAVIERCRAAGLTLRGRLLALSGNLAALELGMRFLGRDLNRMWSAQELQGGPGGAGNSEERERGDLRVHLAAAIADAQGPLVVLDLHSTSAAGAPFSILADTLSNRRLALRLPVPAILGLEERVAGTLLSWIGDQGLGAIGFEGGQHVDPGTARSSEAAIWILLEALGLLRAVQLPWLAGMRAHLAQAARGLPAVVEVRSRPSVRAEDRFEMRPGYGNFQRVARGELLARDVRGDVRAREAGRVLLPLYQGQGDDGFFLTRDVRPAWLSLSGALRRVGGGRLAPYLPGVSAHPAHPDQLLVDRRIARWRALDLLHLLGYRLCDETGEQLVVGRRPDRRAGLRLPTPGDTPAPGPAPSP